MSDVQKIIQAAKARNDKALSEYESKLVLSAFGVPVVQEYLTRDVKEAKEAAAKIGYPVVMKYCSTEVTHKTEKGLIEVGIRDNAALEQAFNDLQKRAEGISGGYLIQEMVSGARELVIGLIRDPQFGPCVMFGLGGIFTEILKDVSFRVAPVEKRDTIEMMQEIKGYKILEAIRGMGAADMDALSQALIGLGKLGLELNDVREVDVNPMILRKNGQPVAVDGLVVL